MKHHEGTSYQPPIQIFLLASSFRILPWESRKVTIILRQMNSIHAALLINDIRIAHNLFSTCTNAHMVASSIHTFTDQG